MAATGVVPRKVFSSPGSVLTDPGGFLFSATRISNERLLKKEI